MILRTDGNRPNISENAPRASEGIRARNDARCGYAAEKQISQGVKDSFTVDAREEILNAQEVARVLKCSRSMVYQLRDRGELQARYKLFEGERGWRWTRGDIQNYLDARTLPGFVPYDVPEKFVHVKIRA